MSQKEPDHIVPGANLVLTIEYATGGKIIQDLADQTSRDPAQVVADALILYQKAVASVRAGETLFIGTTKETARPLEMTPLKNAAERVKLS